MILLVWCHRTLERARIVHNPPAQEAIMANLTKEHVIRLALERMGRYYDVRQARFGTLGGEGFELAVWQRLGVPHASCWLIERDQHRARRLIARYRNAHHFVGELRDFPKSFRTVHPKGTLDVFHWDLCETMEPNARELRAVFPLIAGSTSRCLIVTAADQRGNRALAEADLIDAWWTWLLGGTDAARAFRRYLESEHDHARRRGWTEAESANAATRELSLFLHLLLVLCDFHWEEEAAMHGRAMGIAALDRTRTMTARRPPLDVGGSFAGRREPTVTFLPDALMRSVYYSRVDGVVGRSFRMRTTGLHLARLTQSIAIRGAAVRIASLMMATQLQIIAPRSGGGIRTITVRVPRRGQYQRKEHVMPTKAGLDVGGAVAAPTNSRNSFEALIAEVDAFSVSLAQRLVAMGLPVAALRALVRQATDPLEKLREIERGLLVVEEATRATARMREILGANGHHTVAANADGAVPAVPPTKRRRRKLTNSELLALRLRLLRARAKDEAMLVSEKAAIRAETGFNPRAVAGLLATTCGKFRDGFARKVLRSVTDDARETLAAELEQYGFGKAKALLASARS